MSTAKKVREIIESKKSGTLISYGDFEALNDGFAVSTELSRLYSDEKIERISKGLYSVAGVSELGNKVFPNDRKIQAKLLEESGGYVSGPQAYNELRLTTQVANEVTIVCKKWTRKIKIRNLSIKYVKARFEFQKDDVPYLQLLDAIKDIKKIPDTSREELISLLKFKINKLSMIETEILVGWALKYKPSVKATLGGILQDCGFKSEKLKKSLNPLSEYKVGRIKKYINCRAQWRIV